MLISHKLLLIAVTAILSLILAALIVITQRWHIGLTGGSLAGIQRAHHGITPRVGGIAVYVATLLVSLVAPTEKTELLTSTLIAALPAFFFGFLEDCTGRISSRVRLAATAASGFLAWLLTGYAITHVDISVIDSVLGVRWIAVLFTVFAVAGIAHSVNMIDGLNGLASGVVLIMLGAMAALAISLQDRILLTAILMIMASTLGFLAINFPYGKLFLGDGGAYFLGVMVAWLGVMLAMRHDSISAWAILLICAYPFTEAVSSMMRRYISNRKLDHPDRAHFHSLIFHRFMPRWLPNANKLKRNAATTTLLWVLCLPPAVAGVWLHDTAWACILALLIYMLFYAVVYTRLVTFRWGLPWPLSKRHR
jgi:UDP-N-acetylmuramyl pentapeptide phosphotransferase/UDP-N-acetylglucosamine-1-phosphate transferase